MNKKRSKQFMIGVDEAGRGPLAGPICVATVSWSKDRQKLILNELKGLTDSKQLTEKKREELFIRLKELKKSGLLQFAHSMTGAKQIDKYGIAKCTDISVYKSLRKLCGKNLDSQVLLDGSLKAPASYKNQKTIIKGDLKIPIISAASIVAKVTRDKKMKKLAQIYPEYNFDKHKGYGTKAHKKAIKNFGLSKEHRASFLTR